MDDVSLDIAPREIVGLVGASGSDKSTLGRTMLGLHDNPAGEVVYDSAADPNVRNPSVRDQPASNVLATSAPPTLSVQAVPTDSESL